MFHFTRKRIEAYICICFVALKVYMVIKRHKPIEKNLTKTFGVRNDEVRRSL